MKDGIHPNYLDITVTLRVRQHLSDALDRAELGGRRLWRVPPVLHGQAASDGHARSRRSLPPQVRRQRGQEIAEIGRPRAARHRRASYTGRDVEPTARDRPGRRGAPLHRRPGSDRGRDDALAARGGRRGSTSQRGARRARGADARSAAGQARLAAGARRGGAGRSAEARQPGAALLARGVRA